MLVIVYKCTHFFDFVSYSSVCFEMSEEDKVIWRKAKNNGKYAICRDGYDWSIVRPRGKKLSLNRVYMFVRVSCVHWQI